MITLANIDIIDMNQILFSFHQQKVVSSPGSPETPGGALRRRRPARLWQISHTTPSPAIESPRKIHRKIIAVGSGVKPLVPGWYIPAVHVVYCSLMI